MKHTLALMALMLGLVFGSVAHAQDGAHTSREQAALVEEQELLARKLARLRDSMERLVERFEAEGRVHAAKLLRDGISHLAAGDAQSGDTNLELLMTGSHDELRDGQSMQAIQTQQKVVEDLERLLSILMDRPDLEQLETSLEELKKMGAELRSMADAERQLQQATAELREQSSNEAQKRLEAGLTEVMQEQRKLLRQNEDEARRSGALDLEKLEAVLSELLEDQRTDAAVLGAWRPAALEAAEAPLEELALAREKQARSQRLNEVAGALRKAAQEARTGPADEDLGATVRELSTQAERAARDARAAGDETAARAANALERASERLRNAGQDGEERAAAAQEVDELAATLEGQADAEGQAAERAREAASEALEQLASDEANPVQAAAHEAREALARADEDPQAAQQATKRADRLMRQAVQEMKFLGQALSASQEQNAERAEQLREGLERLPQGMDERGERASQAMAKASAAMRAAARAAREEQPAGASESAQSAAQELEQALSEIAAMREAGSAEQAGLEQLATQQAQLAEQVEELERDAHEASLSEQAEAKVSEALEEAAEAMQRAAQEMSAGQQGSAAKSQRQASQALSRAASEARDGVVPQTEEDQARAEELAQQQAQIEEQLYEFMERYEREQDMPPLPSLSSAQQSSQSAQASLEQGDLSGAQQAEQDAERQIEDALEELAKEEEQYQQLRDEELLFQIAEEVSALRDSHNAITEETLEVHAERTPGKRVSRGQKLRLRKISREEAALATRTKELRVAILEEGSLVFAELLERIERDLTRIARETGETGGYKSDDRVQALQSDVTNSLTWLLDALEEEMERREEESSESEGPPSESENRLVPDVAELRLLSRMEVDVIDTIDELLVLYPELASVEDIDPLLLEDIQRLAVRHERATALFKLFRERLGLPAPGLDPSQFGSAGGAIDEAHGSED